MELTTVGVPAAKVLRGTIDMTAVAPAKAAVRRIKVLRCIGIPEICLFEGFMFVNFACGEVSSGGSALTGKRFQMERKAYRVCRRNSIIQHGFFWDRSCCQGLRSSGGAGVQRANAYGMEAFQLIFARILSNPVVQTSQVWPPPSRNTRSDGITVVNRSIPGSNRS
jgi:hypothetical protein